VDKQDKLRSPHNGHLTMLARAGVPGLALWIALHLTWALGITWSAWRALSDISALVIWFIVLMIYWMAFMMNASFDVYLEGPTGGIWMWTVYGVGIGAMWAYRTCPEALDAAVTQPDPRATRLSVYARPDLS